MNDDTLTIQDEEETGKSKFQATIFYRVYDVILSWPEPQTAVSELSLVKDEPQSREEEKGQ